MWIDQTCSKWKLLNGIPSRAVYPGNIKREDRNMLDQKKRAAREAYNAARKAYIEEASNENWIKFCECKRVCMLLGVII